MVGLLSVADGAAELLAAEGAPVAAGLVAGDAGGVLPTEDVTGELLSAGDASVAAGLFAVVAAGLLATGDGAAELLSAGGASVAAGLCAGVAAGLLATGDGAAEPLSDGDASVAAGLVADVAGGVLSTRDGAAEPLSDGDASVAAGLFAGVAAGLFAAGYVALLAAGIVFGGGGTGADFWAARRASISSKNALHVGDSSMRCDLRHLMTPPLPLEIPAQSCTSGPQEARKAALPVAAGAANGGPGVRAFGYEGGASPGAGRATATRDMHAGDNSPRWDSRHWMRRPSPG